MQAGLDVSFDKRLSPGLLIPSYCISEAIGLGLTKYNFLLGGGMDSFKTMWTKQYRYMCDVYMALKRITKWAMAAKKSKLFVASYEQKIWSSWTLFNIFM